jgi:Restriction endonuclease
MSVIQEFKDYVVIGGVRISKRRPSFDDAMVFEHRVAAIFRSLGADVEHNTSLAGNKIDILVSEPSKAGTTIRSAVECKALSSPVTADAIIAFSGVALFLRNRGLIDKAIVVSLSGFTEEARTAAAEHSIELVELADLERRMRGREAGFEDAVRQVQSTEELKKERAIAAPKRAFVVMPFARESNDIYILGIREVAETLGMVVERADEIQHNGSIPDLIKRFISECDVVIADISSKNPNVMYEVGLAHGIAKETILICDDSKSIPFDLASIHHVEYSSIVELREKLKKRLEPLL